MSSPQKGTLEKMAKSHWRETFNRQWESMKSINEWMNVYTWEIDQETLKFANKNAKMILRLVYLLFEDHLKEITKYSSKGKNEITVQDVLNWTENSTS